MKRLIFFIAAIVWSPFEFYWLLYKKKPSKIGNYIYSKL
jgi:hypothetical protein